MKDNTIKWLFSVSGGRKIYILLLTIVQGLYGASGVLYALLLKNIVDAATGHDSAGFWRGMTMIILLVAMQLALRAVIRHLTELSKSGFENIFKGRLMDILMSREYLQVGAVHSAEWMNRLTNDTVVVAGNMVDILPGLAEMVVKLLSALLMIILLETKFAAILIPGGILLVLFTWLFRKVLKKMHKNVQEADGKLRIFLQERIGSMLMIRSFAAEEQTSRGVAEKMDLHKAARMRKNGFSNLCNIGFGAAMSGMYLLGVGWCGYGILSGTISFGTLTAITQLITQIQTPFANITGYLPKYYAMIASAERLRDAECFQEDAVECYAPDRIQQFYNSLDGFGFKDVSFSYLPVSDSVNISDRINTDAFDEDGAGKMPITLEHLSFTIRKGEYVAFAGQSGCGKSTALKLLMCIYQPSDGIRYYRDIEGKESELSFHYRRLFAYVPQGNALMNGSVREVVSFASPEDASDEDRLWHALRIACADGFVSELKKGADTLLGERGTGLSEGQMQRLAIARAVFADTPVLLLDEATSALDVETEKRLLANLRELTDKTVIIVTHRVAVLEICDRVLEFTEEGIVERKTV